MQRITKMFISFLFSVVFITNISAASVCSTSEQAELRNLVSNMRGTYEEAEEELDPSIYGFPDGEDENADFIPPTRTYFNISITNLSDKFYLEVSNDNDKTKNRYDITDKDNIIMFPWYNLESVTNFTIKVYTSDNTGCPGELMRTITLKVPRLNEYYNYELCTDIPEFSLCQKFVTYNEIDLGTFMDRIKQYITSKENNQTSNVENDNFWDSFKNFISENKYYVIGGSILLITISGVVVAVIVKKQRSSEI